MIDTGSPRKRKRRLVFTGAVASCDGGWLEGAVAGNSWAGGGYVLLSRRLVRGNGLRSRLGGRLLVARTSPPRRVLLGGSCGFVTWAILPYRNERTLSGCEALR